MLVPQAAIEALDEGMSMGLPGRLKSIRTPCRYAQLSVVRE